VNRAALILAFVSLACAQEKEAQEIEKKKTSRDGLEWAVALRGRFGELHNPVIATYGLGRLASLVCAKDRTAGAGLFREALTWLNMLSDRFFGDAGPVLPVSSFSGLWKSIMPEASRCDPALVNFLNADSIRARMAEERRKANNNLSAARFIVESQPDRAAQLADAAIGASDPNVLDIPELSKFMCELRDRAPDLADDLFPKALDFVTSPAEPRLDLLLELGKYLFTAPSLLDKLDSDKKELEEIFDVGGSTIANLMATRESANSDDVESYITSALKVLTGTGNPNYDPIIAYAIAYQLLPKARESMPESADQLQKVLVQLESQVGASGTQIQSKLGRAQLPEDAIGPLLIGSDRMISRALKLAGSNRFADARDALTKAGDSNVESQVKALIDFAEATYAIGRKDLAKASYLANSLNPGVKRSLLYAGIIRIVGRDVAAEQLKLAMKDVEMLPPEQRIYVLSALAAAMLRTDSDWTLTIVNQIVSSSNDAMTRPRRGKFDPKAVREFSPNAERTTDSSLIVFGSRGLYEVVLGSLRRHQFRLQVPGVIWFILPSVLGDAGAVDPKQLEAAILGLHDENRLASALNALAGLRLKEVSPPPIHR
jgi:hypothetical protein